MNINFTKITTKGNHAYMTPITPPPQSVRAELVHKAVSAQMYHLLAYRKIQNGETTVEWSVKRKIKKTRNNDV